MSERQKFEEAKRVVENQIQRSLDFDIPCKFPSIQAFIEAWKMEHPNSFLNQEA